MKKEAGRQEKGEALRSAPNRQWAKYSGDDDISKHQLYAHGKCSMGMIVL